MRKLKTFFGILLHRPTTILRAAGQNGLLNWIPDELYLKIIFRSVFRYSLDFKNVKTYNEKLQWLKLYYRKEELPKLVDKLVVRDYIKKVIGQEYLIPLIAKYDSVESIDWDELPDAFVLKCTHGSGCNIVCTNKSELDIEEAKQKLKRWMKTDYFYSGREWPYKHVSPRIIAEKYMVDGSGYELKDYKFFCFDGEPKICFVATDRGKKDTEVKFDFFDMNFSHLDIVQHHPISGKELTKPLSFEEMIRISRKLSRNFPHVRIDFYDINGHVYFGEFTFFHHSGLVPFHPKEWDYTLGSWLQLPATKY